MPALAQERLLNRLRRATNTSLPVTRMKPTMADSYATPSRSVSSRPRLQFLEALLLGNAAQTPTLLEKLSESHLLRKEALLAGLPSVSFAVDMARCREA